MEDQCLNDGVVECQTTLLQHVVLSKPIQKPCFAHGRHHLFLQAFLSQTPQRLPVLWFWVLENYLLPSTLVPVTFAAGRNVNAAAQDSWPQPLAEQGLLEECGRHLIHVQLTHWIDSTRHFHLGRRWKPVAGEVALECLHLQRCTHEHQPQVATSSQQIPDKYHVEVSELVSLMNLVKDHVCHADEVRVCQHAPSENPECGEHQASMLSLRSKRNLVTDVRTQRTASLLRDALCQGCGRNLAGLHDQNLGRGTGI
mmetsp:Transcript_21767/g.38473  ORF Transcript_21767/g.38473 Transcript_21767/m.38473 type:complete len:255 (+) Transcript_21767:276-1040(+)